MQARRVLRAKSPSHTNCHDAINRLIVQYVEVAFFILLKKDSHMQNLTLLLSSLLLTEPNLFLTPWGWISFHWKNGRTGDAVQKLVLSLAQADPLPKFSLVRNASS